MEPLYIERCRTNNVLHIESDCSPSAESYFLISHFNMKAVVLHKRLYGIIEFSISICFQFALSVYTNQRSRNIIIPRRGQNTSAFLVPRINI